MKFVILLKILVNNVSCQIAIKNIDRKCQDDTVPKKSWNLFKLQRTKLNVNNLYITPVNIEKNTDRNRVAKI